MAPPVLVATLVALACFAANSLLCRMALAGGEIGAVPFLAIRLASGAAVLPVLAARFEPDGSASTGWRESVALAAYGVGFTLAYVRLDTGTGALLLFGSVQVALIGAGFARGEPPAARQLVGGAAATVALLVLVAPGVRAPDPLAAAGMVLAGIAWALYTLWGRGVAHPLHSNGRSFVRGFALTLPLVAGALPSSSRPSAVGVGLAVVSGAITSGVGYAVWYRALRGHTPTSAAVVQLAVPVLAAVGGVAILGEHPSVRLAVAAVLSVGGVGWALTTPRPTPRS